jgi:hypothetical protein
MSPRIPAAITFCVTAILSMAVAAQTRRSPPDSRPDFQGNWVNKYATPLERPRELDNRPLLTDQEVAALNAQAQRSFKDGQVMVVPSGRTLTTLLNNPSQFASSPTYDAAFFTEFEFENRTSLITDPPNGHLPEYTRAGQQRRDAQRTAPEAVQDLPPDTRCITFGMPRVAGVAGTPSAGIYAYYQIVQTRDDFVFFMEAIHDARIIPLDGRPHLPAALRAWDGDSRGHWEGDTLVVETTGFRPEMNFLGAGDHLHLVERFRLAGHNELQYEMRVDDPATWTQPWTAMIRLKRTREQLYEFACHEGNAAIIQDMLAAPSKDR